MQVIGVTGNYDSKTVQNLFVAPGTYAVYTDAAGYITGASGSAATITVNPDGTFAYDASLAKAYTQPNPTTIKVTGFPLTVDATPLTEQQMQVIGVTGDYDSKTVQNLFVAPGTYAVYTDAAGYITGASGSAATITVKADGTVSYDASLANAYTQPTPTTVKVTGFPLTVDATPLTEQQMQVIGVTGDYDSKTVQNLFVAPGTYAVYTDAAGYITGASGSASTITMKTDGTVSYDASLAKAYTQPTPTTVKVTGFPLTVDATPLTEQQMQVIGITGNYDSKTVQNLFVAPGTYAMYTAAGGYIIGTSGSAATLSVKADGTVSYDASLAKAYTQPNPTTVKLTGFPLTVDATPLTEQQMQLPGLTPNFDSKTVQNLFVAPGTYSMYTAAAGYITAANGSASTLTVNDDGTFAYDASLARVYTQPSPATVRIPGFSISVDLTALADQQAQLPGLTGNFDSKSVQNVTVAPGNYHIYLDNTGYVLGPNQQPAALAVKDTGTIDFAQILDATYSGRGSTTVAVTPYLQGGQAAGSQSGTVGIYFGTFGGTGASSVCSGTQITPQWVLTASTCVPQDGDNDMLVVFGDGSQIVPSRFVVNTAEGVALIQVPPPGAAIASNVQALYNGPVSRINGLQVTAYGSGSSDPNPSDVGLEKASFTISMTSPDTYTLLPTSMNPGATLVEGDEGGGTLLADPASGAVSLVGVHVFDSTSGTFSDISSARFHDWVMDQIFGVSSYSYPSGWVDPISGQLNAPEGPFTDNTFEPCGPNGSLTWTAAYDFGGDGSGSITMNGVTTALSGYNLNATGSGTGALTIGVTTVSSEVWGLLSLSTVCNGPTLVCPPGTTECVTNASSVSNTSVAPTPPAGTTTTTWTPCGTGCFEWGATMNGGSAVAGDSITVNGTTTTASTNLVDGGAPAGDTCGSVPVTVTYGPSTAPRSDMDMWAVCGCDDQAHVCATGADGHAQCGTHTNQCGVSFPCGGCPGNAYCGSNGECVSCGAEALCNGACTDTTSDVNNCGSCGSVCPYPIEGARTCNNGCCTFETLCGGSCTFTSADPLNCGTCGNVCPSGVCNGGECCQRQGCSPGQCGAVPDGCGGTVQCGGCAKGDTCQEGTCKACVPNCTNKACGASDGCGGDCGGTCPANYICCAEANGTGSDRLFCTPFKNRGACVGGGE
jgi:hypothetical protein